MASTSMPSGKGAALSREQRKTLVDLIHERPVLQDKSHGFAVCNKKAVGWKEVADLFNASYPLADRKTEKQLKRAWEYIRNT